MHPTIRAGMEAFALKHRLSMSDSRGWKRKCGVSLATLLHYERYGAPEHRARQLSRLFDCPMEGYLWGRSGAVKAIKR